MKHFSSVRHHMFSCFLLFFNRNIFPLMKDFLVCSSNVCVNIISFVETCYAAVNRRPQTFPFSVVPFIFKSHEHSAYLNYPVESFDQGLPMEFQPMLFKVDQLYCFKKTFIMTTLVQFLRRKEFFKQHNYAYWNQHGITIIATIWNLHTITKLFVFLCGPSDGLLKMIMDFAF